MKRTLLVTCLVASLASIAASAEFTSPKAHQANSNYLSDLKKAKDRYLSALKEAQDAAVKAKDQAEINRIQSEMDQMKSSAVVDPVARWRSSEDYYALLELVDRHIDPQWNSHVSKAEVVKYLGEGIHDPAGYPNAGPKFWVYPSVRPVPAGSYLYVTFGDDGSVKGVDWGSE